MDALLLDFGFIGHLADKFTIELSYANTQSNFAVFRNYTDLFGNEGMELITNSDTIFKEYSNNLIKKTNTNDK